MNREAMVQARIMAIYRAAGCTVMNLAQGYRPGGRRHGTTRQSKGLPDLYVFLPRKSIAWWHEVKAPAQLADLDRPAAELKRIYRRRMSPEQALFELRCKQCRVPYVLGGTAEAVAWLEHLGVVQGNIGAGANALSTTRELP